MKCVFMWGQLGSFSLALLGHLWGIELSGARQAGEEDLVAPSSPGERGRHAPAGPHGGAPARPARPVPLLELLPLAQEASETFRW